VHGNHPSRGDGVSRTTSLSRAEVTEEFDIRHRFVQNLPKLR